MSIDFFNLLDDDGWKPLPREQSNPSFFWVDGRPLSQAAVDVDATFAGAMWYSTRIDQSFNLDGLRCRANFRMPRHHLNLRQLIVVFGGLLLVGPDGQRQIGPGQFFVSDAGTPLTMTAGPQGVTYVATRPQPSAPLETYWHDSDAWLRHSQAPR